MSQSLTREQRDIIEETVTNNDGTFAVAAVAGSGKSFTTFQAIDYIKEHQPEAKILYIVFNKANQISAQQKLRKYEGWPKYMQPQVTTAHSYAYRKWLRIFGKFETITKFDWRLISQIKEQKKYQYVPEIKYSKKAPFDKLLEYYEQSKLTLETFCEEYKLKFDDTYEGKDKARSLELTSSKGKKITRFGLPVNGYSCITYHHIEAFKEVYELHLHNKKFTHGMYLKHAAYSPKSGGDEFDYVFFDEAQDSNYFMIKLLEKQIVHKLYYIGDSRQNIYNMGSSNENVFETKTFDKKYTLSQSFRFGDEVAKLANKIVHMHTPNQTCYGTEQTHPTNHNSRAFLYRTNAKLFQDALNIAYNAKQRGISIGIDFMRTVNEDDFEKYNEFLSFIGLYYQYTDSSKFMGVAKYLPKEIYPTLVNFAKNLEQNRHFFNVYNEQYDYLSEDIHSMFEYAKKEDNFVEKYAALQENQMILNPSMTITMCSMHRAKGMEWDIVRICEPTRLYYEDRNGMIRKNENAINEINLAYVAVTRARKELDATILYDELSQESWRFEPEDFVVVLPKYNEKELEV